MEPCGRLNNGVVVRPVQLEFEFLMNDGEVCKQLTKLNQLLLTKDFSFEIHPKMALFPFAFLFNFCKIISSFITIIYAIMTSHDYATMTIHMGFNASCSKF